MNEKKVEAIIDAYTSGMPTAKIQELFECTRNDIKVIRDTYGIPVRAPLKTKPLRCMLPMEAFACYRGKCHRCGWDAEVHERRLEELHGV